MVMSPESVRLSLESQKDTIYGSANHDRRLFENLRALSLGEIERRLIPILRISKENPLALLLEQRLRLVSETNNSTEDFLFRHTSLNKPREKAKKRFIFF